MPTLPRAPFHRLLRPIVLGLLAGHVAFSLLPALTTIRNDFANYYVPARAAAAGRPLDQAYERNWFVRELAQAGLPGLGSFVPQPPANALLLLPLAGLSPLTAKLLWTALLAACGVLSFAALRPLVACSGWWLALVFLLPSAAWANALMYGQPYPLLLLLLVLALRAEQHGRAFLCGLLLGPVLALKLYGLPLLLRFAWARRWRAVAGVITGGGVLTLLSIGVLGAPIHQTYLREIAPRSLAGAIQDPYSPIWGSAASLAHRLFQQEPDLNPAPVTDAPGLARGFVVALPLFVVALAVLAPHRTWQREWAALLLAALVASPLTSSYHLVLLILPVALLVACDTRRWWQIGGLGLLAFAASPAPHYFAALAHGWGNLLAYPRLAALVALLAAALASSVGSRLVICAAALAAGLGGLAGVSRAREQAWQRVEAHGYLLAEPVACEGGLAWTTLEADRLVVHLPDGSVLRTPGQVFGPRCQAGRVVAHGISEAVEVEDADPPEHPMVRVERARGLLRESSGRILASGTFRRPRLSPDGAWVAFESWEQGSWDVRAVERTTLRSVRVTHDAANELEPTWVDSGIVFASDRRRGTGSTALYRVPFER